MSPVRVLLKAYYEQLHERLGARRERLMAYIDALLPAEIARRRFGPLRPDQVEAYRDAALAFVEERLETYNPIGIQYTFDQVTTRRAAELELQLDWYDSRREFEALVAAAKALAREADVSDKQLRELAAQLIEQCGAFPNRSILTGYLEKPTLQKLPDFLVASAIEDVVCGREPQHG